MKPHLKFKNGRWYIWETKQRQRTGRRATVSHPILDEVWIDYLVFKHLYYYE